MPLERRLQLTTPMEGTTAPVKQDTLEMDIIAQVCLDCIEQHILCYFMSRTGYDLLTLGQPIKKNSSSRKLAPNRQESKGEIILSQHVVIPV